MRALTTRLLFENLESSEDSQMHGTRAETPNRGPHVKEPSQANVIIELDFSL